MKSLCLIPVCLLLLACRTAEAELGSSHASIFGDRVMVFDEDMDQNAMQQTLDSLHSKQRRQEFSDERFALLFKPGTYDLDITVDFYVEAMGLGQTPDETVINGAVQSVSTSHENKVTTEFWRGASNFKVYPDTSAQWMFWAVSQAAPMRRMHIVGDINFDKLGWASGGGLANSVVTGRAGLVSGQQWFMRNSDIGRWEGGAWNRVFIGVHGAPEDNWPASPTTVIDKVPVIREKPFLVHDKTTGFSVFVPALGRDISGVSWKEVEAGKLLSLEAFHIARPESDDARTINEVLSSGLNLILTPGIYELDEALEVRNPDTIILGLGLPTLVPTRGNSALEVHDVEGVVIAGLMVDAGTTCSEVLVQIGSEGGSSDHADNPISLHDLYCRVGGAIAGSAGTCLEIHADHVIGDHFWLWRADHGAGADWNINKSDHGLVVTGDDVTIYGLFNEHFQNYQTHWMGERGRLYFYQSEIPYEPPSNEVWNDEGKPGYASYKVAEGVNEHQAYGLGVYSFFRGEEAKMNNVRLENAIEAPEKDGVVISHISLFAGRLGGINHPLNGQGPATNAGSFNMYDGWKKPVNAKPPSPGTGRRRSIHTP